MQVPNWTSPVTKEKTFAKKTVRLLTSPDYLLIQLKKFDVDANWVPCKLDVEVEMPDSLDLTKLMKETPGLQKGEEEMKGPSKVTMWYRHTSKGRFKYLT